MSHKLFGVTNANNLAWSQRILITGKGISQKNDQLSKIKDFISSNNNKKTTSKHFYTVLIQSTIDYASTLRDYASGASKWPIAGVQRTVLL